MPNTEKICGDVVGIIYSNDDNGYKVIEVENEEESFIAVGYFHGLTEGESVVLTGKWTSHPTYGEQFKAELFEKVLPATRSSIQKYLASGIIKGIGESTARKIVEQFGEDSLKILETSPERLSVIKAVSDLDERDMNIIRLRYYENKTQTQTATVLGMTQVQVSRREKKILEILRKELTG